VKKLFRTILILLNWVVLFTVLVSYIAPFVDPQTSWQIAFVGLTFKTWIIALVAFLVLGVWLKTKMFWKNLIVLGIGIPFLLRLFSLHPDTDTTGNFKVASFNTYAIGIYEGLNNSTRIEAFLNDHDVDCAALIEWRFNQGKISKKRYPYQIKIRASKKSNNGILLVSKLPVTASGTVPFTKGSYNTAGYIDVKVNNKPLRIYGVHLETTRMKPRDYHNLKGLEFDSAYTENAKNIAERLKLSMENRAGQVKDITKHMRSCKWPTIIMGDFNDTPQSYTYQQLASGKNDAFVQAGSGFEATFLKPFPFLRIDYILTDETIQPVGYSSTDSIVSDHKLIFADLQIK